MDNEDPYYRQAPWPHRSKSRSGAYRVRDKACYCYYCVCLLLVCRGTNNGITHSTNVDESYNQHIMRYTQCQYVDGNVEIVFLTNRTNYDLSFLKVLLTQVSFVYRSTLYTPWTIKTCHFVSDYNSDVTCSIFIIFVLVERGRNNLQFTHLIARWRHNSVIMHVKKVYFI